MKTLVFGLSDKVRHIPVYSVTDNNEKFRSFKSKENIHKKDVGPYRGFGLSDPIDLAKENTVNLQFLTWQSFHRLI